MSSYPESDGGHADQKPGTFAEREHTTSAMLELVLARVAERDDLRVDIDFHLVEDTFGEPIVSPICTSGELLEHDIDEGGQPALKVLVFEESAHTDDLPFEPPSDFMPEATDALSRIGAWHETDRVDLAPDVLIRQVRYGDIFGLILSIRHIR